MFVELQELYYRNGAYLTKPLLLNASEISSIIEDDGHGYVECRTVVMNNKRSYRVKDRYSDIVGMINGN